MTFTGVDECVKETWLDSEKKVLDIIEKTMDLRDITIDRAHRIGKARSQARPIVVKFLNYKDREQVLKSGKCLKGTPINVREDLSTKVINKRKEQMSQLREARENGKIAFFSYDKLIIKDPVPPTSAPLTPDPSKDGEPKRILTRSYSTTQPR